MSINKIAPGTNSDVLEAVFARNSANALAEREARERAARWPGDVEHLLATLAERSASQEAAIEALTSRVATLEDIMSNARG